MKIIQIDILKNHPEAIPQLSDIWHEVLGKIWLPEVGIEEIRALYDAELKSDRVFTQIALLGDCAVGSCTLQIDDDIRPDLGPWISDLVVHPDYQKQGIGKMLLDATVTKAKELGFKRLNLFAFDSAIPAYYQRFGWKVIGMDQYRSHPITLMEIGL